MKFLLCFGLTCILAVLHVAAAKTTLPDAISDRTKDGQTVVETIKANAQALKNYIGQPKLDVFLKTDQDIRNFLSVIAKTPLPASDVAVLIPKIEKNSADTRWLKEMFKSTFVKKCNIPAAAGMSDFFRRVRYFADGVAKIVETSNSAELTVAFRSILDDIQAYKRLYTGTVPI
ncbi:uncharacterized protein LOC129742640 [Uranotaenia lowii]|uniref:uncharacterized protein LOC129742640 n=1 Tax=Uranotaenia lowii TaxID=190385 RepID=UPI00247AC93F|nr:uncharacterized protein LOC129742640 [Uranotaenia lowii]